MFYLSVVFHIKLGQLLPCYCFRTRPIHVQSMDASDYKDTLGLNMYRWLLCTPYNFEAIFEAYTLRKRLVKFNVSFNHDWNSVLVWVIFLFFRLFFFFIFNCFPYYLTLFSLRDDLFPLLLFLQTPGSRPTLCAN